MFWCSVDTSSSSSSSSVSSSSSSPFIASVAVSGSITALSLTSVTDTAWLRCAAGLTLAAVAAHAGQALAVTHDMDDQLMRVHAVATGVASITKGADVHSTVVHALFADAVSATRSRHSSGTRSESGIASLTALAVALHTVPSNASCAAVFRDTFRCLHHDALLADAASADVWFALLPLLAPALLHKVVSDEQVTKLLSAAQALCGPGAVAASPAATLLLPQTLLAIKVRRSKHKPIYPSFCTILSRLLSGVPFSWLSSAS
jgi:hypothetical protein